MDKKFNSLIIEFSVGQIGGRVYSSLILGYDLSIPNLAGDFNHAASSYLNETAAKFNEKSFDWTLEFKNIQLNRDAFMLVPDEDIILNPGVLLDISDVAYLKNSKDVILTKSPLSKIPEGGSEFLLTSMKQSYDLILYYAK